MRNLHLLDHYRKLHAAYGHPGDSSNGYFEVPYPGGVTLRVIASTGLGWDHVSVSCKSRCPTWEELDFIARMFFAADETAIMQLHLPAKEHINYHPHCLHLWRPNDGREIPKPPAFMVGPRPKTQV